MRNSYQTTKIWTLMILMISSITALADQGKLDAERDQLLDAVLESLKQGDAKSLSSHLPGCSEKEASATIKRISAQWGDLAKLARNKKKLAYKGVHKGNMNIVAHWSIGRTSLGKWLELQHPSLPKHRLRVGLLFDKGSLTPSQLMAVEWDGNIPPVLNVRTQPEKQG